MVTNDILGKIMEWEDLKHGDRVEAFWHFNSLSFDFYWKQGTVYILLSGGKKFVPDDGLGTFMLFPHRMDEVRELGSKNNQSLQNTLNHE